MDVYFHRWLFLMNETIQSSIFLRLSYSTGVSQCATISKCTLWRIKRCCLSFKLTHFRAGYNTIARYDLETRTGTAQLSIENSLHRGSQNLFCTGYNYYDLAVDENGLWVVYAYQEGMMTAALPDTLMVAKLEPNYLDIEKTWNVTVTRNDYCNSFIAHGILYLLDSATDKNTQFSFVYDLYSHTSIDISLPFINVFGKNQMLAYGSSKAIILAWDAGRIISYPILAA